MEHLYSFGGKVNQSPCENQCGSSQNMEIDLPHHPDIHSQVFTQRFQSQHITDSYLHIHVICSATRCNKVMEQIQMSNSRGMGKENAQWYISSYKKNENLLLVEKLMQVQINILSELNQYQKDKYHLLLPNVYI